MAIETQEKRVETPKPHAPAADHLAACSTPGKENLGKTDGKGCDVPSLTLVDDRTTKKSSDAPVDPKYKPIDQTLSSDEKRRVNTAMTTLTSNPNATDKAIKYLDPKSPDFDKLSAEVTARMQTLVDQHQPYDQSDVNRWTAAVDQAKGKPAEPKVGSVKPVEPGAISGQPATADALSGQPARGDALNGKAVTTDAASDTTTKPDAVSGKPAPPDAAIKGDPPCDTLAARSQDPLTKVHDQSLTVPDKITVNAAMFALNSNDHATDTAIKNLNPTSPNFGKRAAEVRTRLQDMVGQGLFSKDEVGNWDKAVAAATPAPVDQPVPIAQNAHGQSAVAEVNGGNLGQTIPVSERGLQLVSAPSDTTGGSKKIEATAGTGGSIASDTGNDKSCAYTQPRIANPDPKFDLHDPTLVKSDRMNVNAAMLTLNSNDNATEKAIKYLGNTPDFDKCTAEIRQRLEAMVDKGLFDKNTIYKWDAAVANHNQKRPQQWVA